LKRFVFKKGEHMLADVRDCTMASQGSGYCNVIKNC